MCSLQPDLDWLLAPVGRGPFVERYWQQQPVHLNGRGGAGGWFSSRDLEELIEVAQPKPPSIRLAAHERESIAVPELSHGRLDTGEIRRAFLDGYTIIVNNVQRYHPALHQFVQTLQQSTSYPVEANCYFTPPGAQGFHPHYDSHDVFAIQIEGSKQWKLYGESAARDLHELVDGDPFDRGDLPEPDALTMRPGDVLYIPRGWVHEAATAADSASLHVTLGMHCQTGRDLLRAAVDAMCRADPAFLRPLPIGFLDGDLEQIADLFVDLHTRLGSAGPVATATAFLHDEHIRRTVPHGSVGLADLGQRLAHLSADDVVQRSPETPARFVEGEDLLVLQFLSRLVRLPIRFREAVDYVLGSTGPFRVGTLPALTADDQVELAQRLVADGLLCHSAPG